MKLLPNFFSKHDAPKASDFRPPVWLHGKPLVEHSVSASVRPAWRFIFILCLPWLVAFPGGCRKADARPANAVTVTDASGAPVVIRDASRIVAAGGSVTEIVFALGAENRLVGVDQSSVFPEAAMKLPQVGYVRTLASEGVLSLNPTLFISTTEAGPPPALAQLRESGVPVLLVSGEHGAEGVKRKIRAVAAALGRRETGENLVADLEKDLAEAAALVAGRVERPRVMFIYARGQGTLNVAGKKTAADEMIRLAGGVNAFEYENYKPLSAESVVAAAPDVILLPSRGLDAAGGIEGVLKLPGVAQSPAGRNRRVVAMDDLVLLGFGPRTGKGVKELFNLLHPVSGVKP